MTAKPEIGEVNTTPESTHATRPLRLAGVILLVLSGSPSASLDWYWGQKAQMAPMQAGDFWGDDVISDGFRWVCNWILLPVWNWLFAIDTVRYVVAIAFAAFIAALGADVYKYARDNLLG